MAQPFAPLIPAAPSTSPAGRTETRLRVIPADTAALQTLPACRRGLVAVEAPHVSAPNPASPAAGSAEAPAHAGAASVELVRDGDRVCRIQVRCSCGELIELECEYG